MDKFTEEAFKKAIEESNEARDAFRAWGEFAIPAFLTAIEKVGKDEVARLVAALEGANSEDVFFGICQIFFLAGFNCGRNE